MAHTNQERWATLVDAKLRSQLVTRDNLIFNNRYEGDPKAGKVKIPVRRGRFRRLDDVYRSLHRP